VVRPITTTNQNDNEWEDDITTILVILKIMGITETFELLRNFSHKYHPQPISYYEIFQELLDFYNKEHEQKWF
jgi:hypothetical protein